ncbi:pirin family protein [Sphingosinicella sp.]|uniref:pirin family protein n=1 Tax=Sphingosinicella sp. TaxID=1917971 RepID=UPI0035AF6D04
MILRRIEGRRRDLGGGFVVRRVLPVAGQRMVGPFIFWDHFGPVDYAPGDRFDVRPHPHINLATVTYLFEGEIFHRDSLGSAQAIRPGAVNWMTAGRGITHSERTSPEVQAAGQRMEGIQAWVALPKTHEEVEPSFVHHPADTLPVIEQDGARLTVIAGTAYGRQSPVGVVWPTFYVDVDAKAGATIDVSTEHEERAIYVASGRIALPGGEVAEEATMLVLEPGAKVEWTAETDARVLMLGGKAMDGPREIWWNFVSSRPERLNQAIDDWEADRFAHIPGDDDERIPLPSDPRPKA